MPSAEQLRSRLLKKLSELFQLDQPEEEEVDLSVLKNASNAL